jgi:hypothetical protein
MTLYGLSRASAQRQPPAMMHMNAIYVASETVPLAELKFNPKEIMEPRNPPRLYSSG